MHACNYGTETNRLLCDILVSGIKSDKAYSQCITKGNELTLQECIEICKNVDAMDRQMKACRKDKEDTTPTATEVHKMHQMVHTGIITTIEGMHKKANTAYIGIHKTAH